MSNISIETVTGIFSSIMSWFFWLVIVFFAAMLFDYASGSLAALKNKTWTSTKAREGLFHKLGICGALVLAILIDVLVGLAANTVIKLPFEFPGLFSPLCAVWYILTEFGSIAENLQKMGINLPRFLTTGLAQMHNAADKAGESYKQPEDSMNDDK